MKKWISQHSKYILALLLITAAIAAFSPWQIIPKSSSNELMTITLGTADASPNNDYTLTATNCNVPIQQALNALPVTGGKLRFNATGTFTLAATVSRAINNVVIEGPGQGLLFTYNNSSAIFSAGTQSGWTFRDFATDTGGISYSSSTHYIIQNMLIGTTYIGCLTDQWTPTGGVATVTIAPQNASAADKQRASVILTGLVHDDVTLALVIALYGNKTHYHIFSGLVTIYNALYSGEGHAIWQDMHYTGEPGTVIKVANGRVQGDGVPGITGFSIFYIQGAFNGATVSANITIESITFDGNEANQSGGTFRNNFNMIQLVGTKNITVTKCNIINSAAYGIFTSSWGTDNVGACQDIRITNNYFFGNIDGDIKPSDGDTTQGGPGFVIQGNTSNAYAGASTSRGPWFVDAEGGGNRMSITGNMMNGGGINLRTSSTTTVNEVSITGNTIYTNWVNNHAIKIHDYAVNVDRVVISGNTIYTDKGNSVGIEYDGLSGLITSNYIQGFVIGLRFGKGTGASDIATGNMAHDNLIDTCTTGVQITTGASRNSVKSNVVRTCTTAFSIADAGCTKNVIAYNTVKDCGTDIADSGTGSILVPSDDVS